MCHLWGINFLKWHITGNWSQVTQSLVWLSRLRTHHMACETRLKARITSAMVHINQQEWFARAAWVSTVPIYNALSEPLGTETCPTKLTLHARKALLFQSWPYKNRSIAQLHLRTGKSLCSLPTNCVYPNIYLSLTTTKVWLLPRLFHRHQGTAVARCENRPVKGLWQTLVETISAACVHVARIGAFAARKCRWLYFWL